MGFVNLTCPTCKGKGVVFDRLLHHTKCIPCGNTGSILVHANSISGNRANRVITDEPWSKVWEQLDLFE